MLRYFSYILVCGHSATISVLFKSKLAINLVKLPLATWSLLFSLSSQQIQDLQM